MTTLTTNSVRIPIKYKRDKLNPHYSYWTHQTGHAYLPDVIVAYDYILKNWADLGNAKRANLVVSSKEVANAWLGIVSEDGNSVLFTGKDRSVYPTLNSYLEVELRESAEAMAGHVWVYLELVNPDK